MKKMIMVIVTVAIIAASFFAGMKTYEYKHSDEYLVRTYCEVWDDSTLTSDVEISDDGEWYLYESVDEEGNHYYSMARISHVKDLVENGYELVNTWEK